MKKVLSLAVCLFVASMAFAQKGVVKFKESDFDFGKITQGKPVTHVFEFTNTGTDPVILGNVAASCGCTTPEWTKEPVLPGKSGKVTGTFNAGVPGAFNKTITVPSNAENGTVYLTLKGEVLAAAAATEAAPAPAAVAAPAAVPTPVAAPAAKKAARKKA